jgi:hypothetical protein
MIDSFRVGAGRVRGDIARVSKVGVALSNVDHERWGRFIAGSASAYCDVRLSAISGFALFTAKLTATLDLPHWQARVPHLTTHEPASDQLLRFHNHVPISESPPSANVLSEP